MKPTVMRIVKLPEGYVQAKDIDVGSQAQQTTPSMWDHILKTDLIKRLKDKSWD